jgi:23S rRNA pseudouridine2605 synthase
MTKQSTPAPTSQDKERIAKRLAALGVASRRSAEQMIADGRVQVNGQLLTTPAFLVGPEDDIVVDGRQLASEKPLTRLWRYHKPAGLVTTARDPQGRPTVFDDLPKKLGRVISVGRLDLNSEGLLLLTNNGELSRHLELPSTGWRRVYRVRVHGSVDKAALAELQNGITYEGITYGPIEAMVEKDQRGSNTWLRVALHEGKNREIRQVMRAIGLSVNRLIRQSYGPFDLGDLAIGAVDEVPTSTLRRVFGDQFERD